MAAAGDNTGRSATVASRVLELGYQLFLAREYSPLAALTQLAGTSGAQDGGSEFLRGLSLACQLAATPKGSAHRQALVADAAGCFFRAAASLKSGESAG